MPLPVIMQLYIVCASIGTLFLVVCAFMGATHHGGPSGGHSGGDLGHTGAGGHTGIGHTGAGGHTAIGHSGGHAAGHTAAGHSAAGHSAAGHSAAGHTAGHSSASGGTHSGGGDGSDLIQAARLQARTGPFHAPNRRGEHPFGLEKVLEILNPTVITTFLSFFGLTGLFFFATWPILSWITLVPAFIGGLVAIKVMSAIMSTVFSRLNTSSAATENDLIGHMAEVTVPITDGRTGEVTYIVSSKRYTSPAKSKDPAVEIKKGTKVMIYDRLDNYVLVEVWTDSFIDPSFEDNILTPQEKLAKKQSENMY